jgi:hypothetical protein
MLFFFNIEELLSKEKKKKEGWKHKRMLIDIYKK